MDRFFGVVLELNRVFVLLVSSFASKSICNLIIALFLPAASITLDRLPLRQRVTNDLHPPVPTLAIVAHFSLTGCFWALGARVAQCLALVRAIHTFFIAFHAAAVLKQVLSRFDAFAGFVAYFLAAVATLELFIACLAA